MGDKMIQKRFAVTQTVLGSGIYDYQVENELCESYDEDAYVEACRKLNELNEMYLKLKHRHSLLHDECTDLEVERNRLQNDVNSLEKENKELKKQLKREETDKKRLMSYLMRYKGFGFDEIVDDFFEQSSYDTWWENGFYEFCWDEYLKEKGFDGCDVFEGI